MAETPAPRRTHVALAEDVKREERRRALRLAVQVVCALILAPLLLALGPLLFSALYALADGRALPFFKLMTAALVVGLVAWRLWRKLDDRQAAERLRRKRRRVWRDAF